MEHLTEYRIPMPQSKYLGTSPIPSIGAGRDADASRSRKKPEQLYLKGFKTLIEAQPNQSVTNIENQVHLDCLHVVMNFAQKINTCIHVCRYGYLKF